MTPDFRAPRSPETPAAKRPWPGCTPRAFLTASKLDQLPVTELPEIAFVGRSNAGKSTAINTLAQHKRLAFASRTPGRTQHINLFEVGPRTPPTPGWPTCPATAMRSNAPPSCAGRR
jgi:GTP-binding protein